jgi:hypothetical protein
LLLEPLWDQVSMARRAEYLAAASERGAGPAVLVRAASVFRRVERLE